MHERLAVLLRQFRGAFRREVLPPPPLEAQRPRTHRGIASLLFTIEPLPFDPTTPSVDRGGFFATVFPREALGVEAPPPAPGRRGLLATIFAGEHLALDPEVKPGRGPSWLAWLLLPERLDQDGMGPEAH